MTPPPPRIAINHQTHHPHPHLPLQKPSSLPDLLLTALSLLFFLSSPSKLQTFSLKIPPLPYPQNPRRLFLNRPLIMSQSIPNPNRNRSRFSSPQSLSDWLRPRLSSDSFASWGVKPGTKNVHNLWLELFEGETLLADSVPPVRTLQVVTVRIVREDGRVLLESHQELSDGSVRERGRPLSEKMKPGETPECAVVRAVREELGSILIKGASLCNVDDGISIVRIVPGSYQRKVEERVSVSYPGLPACYVLHSVDAWVDGLPDGEFCTEEEEEYGNCSEVRTANGAVSVKRHYWKWVDSDFVST